MEQEKLTLQEIENDINKKKFILTMLINTPEVGEIKPNIKELITQVHTISGEILELFKQKEQLETDHKEYEESFNFPQIEQEVLASLPEGERERMTVMNSVLQKEHWIYYQTSYEQAIMKLYHKEVAIWKDSVKFLYAHKELDREEIEMTYGSNYVYKWFSDQKISRREIQQQYLDDTHPSHDYILRKIKNIETSGKYIATEENTFTPILNWFTGTLDKRIKALQFLTGFIGYCIISLEKDPLNGHKFLDFRRKISGMWICKNNHPEQQGSLLVAKDC